MLGDHAKKEMETDEKPTTSNEKALSGESRNKKKRKEKKKEKKTSSHKSHRSSDKIKKTRKVVYYETDTSSPSTSGSVAPSITSKSARSLVRSPYIILILLDILHYFPFH
jgi:hypothetical protein